MKESQQTEFVISNKDPLQGSLPFEVNRDL